MIDNMIGLLSFMGMVYGVIGFILGAHHVETSKPITCITRGIFWFPIFIRDMLREAWRIFREE